MAQEGSGGFLSYGSDVGRLSTEDQTKLVFERPKRSDVMLALEYFQPARGILPIAFEEEIFEREYSLIACLRGR